jgi:predicted HicB family RNase H-like nuclease
MSELTFHHKGYTALAAYSPEDQCYTGQVIGIQHMIIFDGSTLEEARANFKDLIDDYPGACAELGVEPNLPPVEAAANC